MDGNSMVEGGDGGRMDVMLYCSLLRVDIWVELENGKST